MAKPIISVVMPVLNPHPVYFRQAVESILNQTLEDWELVIVEDPSPRSAAEILRNYPDPRIRHFVNPQRTSLVQQRNRALQEARAELIACQDADDISEPERLAKQFSFMEKNPEITVLGTQLTVIDGDGNILGYRRYPCGHDEIVQAMPRYNPIGQPSVMFRKEVVLKFGGYQYDVYPAVEDYDLWCRLAREGFKFANLLEALVRYRVHVGGMKASKLRGVLKGTIELKKMHWRDQMDFQTRLRLFAEHILLLLPPKLVLWLFLKTQIHKSL